MCLSPELEVYIFNCLARYEAVLRHYRDDAMQEIRLAILVSGGKKEALQMANCRCGKMLRQFGYRRNGTVQRYKAHCRLHHEIAKHQSVFD
jgi:hypothetical protein